MRDDKGAGRQGRQKEGHSVRKVTHVMARSHGGRTGGGGGGGEKKYG